MFLSLVRPERISSPITSSAAVTCSAAVSEFAVAIDDPSAPGPTQQAIPTLPLCVIMLQVVRRGRPLPAKKPPDGGGGDPPRRGQAEKTLDARTGAAAPHCLCTPTHRLRAGPQRSFALPIKRALGTLRSELGAPFPCGGRAQSGGIVPGRARRRRLAQVDLRSGTTARRRAGAEPD